MSKVATSMTTRQHLMAYCRYHQNDTGKPKDFQALQGLADDLAKCAEPDCEDKQDANSRFCKIIELAMSVHGTLKRVYHVKLEQAGSENDAARWAAGRLRHSVDHVNLMLSELHEKRKLIKLDEEEDTDVAPTDDDDD